MIPSEDELYSISKDIMGQGLLRIRKPWFKRVHRVEKVIPKRHRESTFRDWFDPLFTGFFTGFMAFAPLGLEAGPLKGSVKNYRNRPVAEAIVYAKQPRGGIVDISETDISGNYRLDLEPSDYIIKVFYRGKRFSKSIRVPSLFPGQELENQDISIDADTDTKLLAEASSFKDYFKVYVLDTRPKKVVFCETPYASKDGYEFTGKGYILLAGDDGINFGSSNLLFNCNDMGKVRKKAYTPPDDMEKFADVLFDLGLGMAVPGGPIKYAVTVPIELSKIARPKEGVRFGMKPEDFIRRTRGRTPLTRPWDVLRVQRAASDAGLRAGYYCSPVELEFDVGGNGNIEVYALAACHKMGKRGREWTGINCDFDIGNGVASEPIVSKSGLQHLARVDKFGYHYPNGVDMVGGDYRYDFTDPEQSWWALIEAASAKNSELFCSLLSESLKRTNEKEIRTLKSMGSRRRASSFRPFPNYFRISSSVPASSVRSLRNYVEFKYSGPDSGPRVEKAGYMIIDKKHDPSKCVLTTTIETEDPDASGLRNPNALKYHFFNEFTFVKEDGIWKLYSQE
ncbi:MAG: carboxypeptidase regulatory-like domain-containing protein [Candidatus Aenigmarchaeota archaeon]|nr:carboxypeptidase regulatory-like domain-containing protein [Candidatus Aenigmarchaeota archaeon]